MPFRMGATSSPVGRGTRAAVVGAVLGLVPAMVIGSLRFLLAEEPERAEQLASNTVFALVYASPYLLTIIASKERRPGVRGGLLAAFGILSFLASFSSLAGVTIVLLPATFIIWFAAARSLTASVRPLATTLLAAIAGLAVAATVGLSFFALYGIQDPDVRCWVLSHGADGQSIWESRPNVGGPGRLNPGPLSDGPAMVSYDGGVTWQRVGPLVGSLGHCTSDIITNSEAAMSMGILATAFVGMLLMSMRRRLFSWGLGGQLPFKQSSPPQCVAEATQHELTQAKETNLCELSRIRKMLGTRHEPMSSLAMLSTGGGIPVRQTKLAPDGLEFSEDVSESKWVEESLSDFGTLRSLIPHGFSAYARVFHPAYMDGREDRPVRWSKVASWTGRTVHPLMQFERIAVLSEGPSVMYEDPPWGSHPQIGSIPEVECRTLVEVLRGFTSTPGSCYFCLWEGYGNIDKRLYRADSRVRAPGRDYLLFRGPIDAIMA